MNEVKVELQGGWKRLFLVEPTMFTSTVELRPETFAPIEDTTYEDVTDLDVKQIMFCKAGKEC